MSTRPLVSGAASLAATFHLLIDELLLTASQPAVETADKLSKLLREAAAAAEGDTSLDGLLLDSILRNEKGEPHPGLARLADQLENLPITETTQRALEKLAQRVSDERTALLTRTGTW